MVAPSPKSIQAASEIMTRALQDLHKIIEDEYNNKNPREIMVLMMSFVTGMIIQLKDKTEVLQKGLGDKFIEAINLTIQKDSKETIDKLNKGDPSIYKSSSNIKPDDLASAVNFVVNNFASTMELSMDALPITLRNEETLLISLAQLIVNLLSSIGKQNITELINKFSKNMHSLTGKSEINNKPVYN